jgi:O-antigen ligase
VSSHAAARPARAATGRLLIAVAAGIVLGVLAVNESGVLTLDLAPSPALAIASAVAALALALILWQPQVGILLLAGLTFSNASDILVREHGLPSVMELLVPVLLAILVARPALTAAPREVAGLTPVRLFAVGACAYLGVLLASTTWALDTIQADARVVEIGKAAVLGLVLAHVVADRVTWRRVAWTLVLTGAVLAALSSFQVLTQDWSRTFGGFARVKEAQIAGEDLGARATGPLADPNFYAQALLPLVPLALALALGRGGRLLRAVAWIAAAVLTMGVVTTYSRGGALALLVSLALLLALERRRIRVRHLAVAAAAIAIVATLLPSSFFVRRLGTLSVFVPGNVESLETHDSSVDKRKVLMATAAAMALDHPVAGVGAGNFSAHFDEYSDGVGARARIYQDPGERAFPHSLYLEILAETGVVGLLAFALVVAAAFRGALAAARRFRAGGDDASRLLAHAQAIGLVGFLTSSLILHGDYPHYLWLYLGLCVAASRVAAREAP